MKARFVPAVAPVAVLIGCGDATGPEHHLDVRVTSSAERMEVGDSVLIRVTAANPSPHPISYTTSGCHLMIEIVNSAGTRVYPGPLVCTLPEQPWELGPGEEIGTSLWFYGTSWRRRLDDPGAFESYALDPGAYRIFGGVTMQFLSRSAPIELEIVPESVGVHSSASARVR